VGRGDDRDARLGERADAGVDDFGERRDVGTGAHLLGHVLHVAAGAESATGGIQHDRAHVVTVRGLAGDRGPRVRGIRVEGVQALGAVQRDARESVLHAQQDRVGHLGAIRMAPSRRIVSPLR
jgi:hypothetical protein